MADKKATYDVTSGEAHQKSPTSLYHEKNGTTSNGTNPFGGKYMDTAQSKGKIILPTALWVLLIIAGLCFLTMLATLNKTMGTLDTIVELEQGRAEELKVAVEQEPAKNDHRNHHRHHHHHSQSASSEHIAPELPPGGALSSDIPSPDILSDIKMEIGKLDQDTGKPQWIDVTPKFKDIGLKLAPLLSFPDWTSLEPKHREESHLSSLESPLFSLIPKFTAFVGPELAQEVSPDISSVSGHIVIKEGPIGDNPDRPHPIDLIASSNEPLRNFDSIFNNFGLPSFVKSYNENPSRMDGYTRDKIDEKLVHEPAMISAKIDNVHIHLGQPESIPENERPKLNGDILNSSPDTIDKLIDELSQSLGKQSDRPVKPTFSPPQRLPNFNVDTLLSGGQSEKNKEDPQIESQINSILSDLNLLSSGFPHESQPHDRHHSQKHHHRHHHHHHHQGDYEHDKHHRHSSHAEQKPAPDEISSFPIKFVADIRDDDNQLLPSFLMPMSQEMNRFGVSNTRRPMFGASPYEINLSSEQEESAQKKPQFDSMWGAISNEIADSLMNSMIDSVSGKQDSSPAPPPVLTSLPPNHGQRPHEPPQELPKPFPAPAHAPATVETSEPMIFINGKPLAPGEQPDMASLLGLFNRPPVDSGESIKGDNFGVPLNLSPSRINELFGSIFDVSPLPTRRPPKFEDKTDDEKNVSEVKKEKQPSSESLLPVPELVNKILNEPERPTKDTMTTAAIEQKEPIAVDVSGEPSSSAQSKGQDNSTHISVDKNSTDSKGPATNSTKESMMCECSKLPAQNKTSSSAGPASSSKVSQSSGDRNSSSSSGSSRDSSPKSSGSSSTNDSIALPRPIGYVPLGTILQLQSQPPSFVGV